MEYILNNLFTDSQNATKECSEQLFKRLLQVESKISELGNRSQQNEDRIGDQKNQTETIKDEVARLYQKVDTSVEHFTESNENFRLQTKGIKTDNPNILYLKIQ